MIELFFSKLFLNYFHVVYDKQCEPGKPFKYYCNTCSCSASGTVGGCTRMACNEDLWNEDGSRKIGDQGRLLLKYH